MDINALTHQAKQASNRSHAPEATEHGKAHQHSVNEAILEQSINVSIASGNDSMRLLFEAAIKGINEHLEPYTGEAESLQAAYEQGIDVSPEATADRIVSMSTAFFGAFQEQHSDMSEDEAREAFIDVIGRGIDQGFDEAREILDGLGVLDGEIASNIDKTYDLVEEGLLEFAERGSDE